MIEKYGIINDRSPHIIADLFELMAFFKGEEISRGDIETYLVRDGGEALSEEVSAEAGHDASSADVNERFQKLSEEVFIHFSYRQAAFGDWYPFVADGDVLSCKEPLTDKHKLYMSLACYSRMQMFSKSNQIKFAANFEKLCVEAVKGMFSGWDIFHFGKGGKDRAIFGNKLNKAIKALAEKMKDIAIDERIKEIDENDTGDGGIDIVALNDLQDLAPGVAAYFGQCAARQQTWPEKKFEASALNIERYISFFHKPGTLLFIPLFHRNPDGKWVEQNAFAAILIDRLRIVQLLERRGDKAAVKAALDTVPTGLIESRTAAA